MSVQLWSSPLALASAVLALGLWAVLHVTFAAPHTLPVLGPYCDGLDRDLKALMLPANGCWILRGQLIALCGIAAAASTWTPLLGLIAPAIALAPSQLLRRSRVKRAEALEAQLDSFLLALTNSLKATPALGSALEAIVPLSPEPTRAEFAWALSAFKLGTPLDEALTALSARVPSRALATAVTMLCIARRTGGDLSRSLETCAGTLREMARLEGVVRTKTASGKAQATAIGVLPVPLVLLLNWIDPDFLLPLTNSFTGHLLIALSVVLWMTAILLANRIVAVDL